MTQSSRALPPGHKLTDRPVPGTVAKGRGATTVGRVEKEREVSTVRHRRSRQLPPPLYEFPPVDVADEDGVVAIGGDLDPGTLLHAYRRGLFPMPLGPPGARPPVIGWWSPDPRGVLPLGNLRVSRSLRRSLRRYEIRFDTAFDAVISACARPDRPGGWISPEIEAAYRRLHELGWAHSVEAWDVETSTLVGGLYGVAVGGLFAGESMFHFRTDASKVALVGLVDALGEDGVEGRLLDVQWLTGHLASMGAVETTRSDYLRSLRSAVDLPSPPAFAHGVAG
jgi:leucyl/phenylalanyl-tRNA---protein transferase